MKKNTKMAVHESSGDFADFGAIFMANRQTMEECLSRNLFGLPSPMVSFVGGVRTGMVLFLFEYEKRTLHGVFEATSDGAMDIVPQAYASSGKRFPAQVRFERIWDCEPLREDDFRDAIKENYYDRFKFRFGLSQEQVCSLLRMFNSTRKKVTMIRSLSCERSKRRDPETKRFSFQRTLSSGKSTEICKKLESSHSDQTVKGNARGSCSSGNSRTSLSSFECESGPNDFCKGSGFSSSEEVLGLEELKPPSKDVSTTTNLGDFITLDSLDISTGNDQMESVALEPGKKLEEHLKVAREDCGDFIPLESPDNGNDQIKPVTCGPVKDSEDHSKDVSPDLGDFIPLSASPDDSDDETDSSRNGRIEFIPFDRYVPMRLMSCDYTEEDEGVRDSSEDNDDQKIDESDEKAGSLCIKGLYSDDQSNRSSVFSRLKFGPKERKKENEARTKMGGTKKSVFSRLSVSSKIMQNINSALSDHRKATEKETELTPRHGEDDSKSTLPGRDGEEKPNGNDTVEDIMDALLQRRCAWRKTDPRYKDPEQHDSKPVAKNVFSRLAWVNVTTVTLSQGYSQGYRVRDSRFCDREASGNYRRNRPEERWSEKRKRDGEETHEKSAHISKKPKRQSEAEKTDCVNGSESKFKSEERPRRKLTRPVFEETPEVRTTDSKGCVNVQIPSKESTNRKESIGSCEFPNKESIGGEKVAVRGSDGCSVTPLETYKMCSKRVCVLRNSSV